MEQQHDAMMLPGFDPSATSASDSGLRDAAIATLDALRDAGLLTARHALTAQVILATSERAGIGLQAGRTTIATTNLLRLLSELLEKLPVDEVTVADGADSFLKLLAAAEVEALAGR